MASSELRDVFLPALGGVDTATDSLLLKPTDLSVATNMEYEQHGGRFKRGGTIRYNANAITLSGTAATISAMADFWRFGTTLTATQQFVVSAATQSAGAIYSGDAAGVLTLRKAPWGAAGRRNSIQIAQGLAVLSDGVDTAQIWDQTTMSTISLCFPVFSACKYHLRRLFYYGVSGSATASSSVGYTAAGNIRDATGSDAGAFIFDEDDGDRVVGVSEPWRERLLIFKGPTRGSVHQIGGTSPVTFTKGVVFRQAAPCVANAGIITTSNDIFWMSRYGMHSLQATQKYGDTEEAYISFPVQNQFNELNTARLDQSVGFYNPIRNIIGWAAPNGTSIVNNTVFVYHYLLNFWSIWTFTDFDAASFMLALDPLAGSQKPRLFIGDYAGVIHAGDQTVKSDGAAPYTDTTTTPPIFVFQGKDALTEAVFSGVTTFVRPTGATCSLAVIQDGRTTHYSVDLSNTAVNYVETPLDGDRSRSIQLEWKQDQAGQDMHLLGFAIRYKPADTQARESS
jgi:hypothetical protein